MTALSALVLASLAAAPARAQPDQELVRVNGTPIRRSEIVERLWRVHGPQTVQAMVDELLLRQQALARKVKPDAAEVKRRLRLLEEEAGDAKSLEAKVRQSGSTMERLREEVADAVAREALVVQERGLKVADAELKPAFEARRDALATPARLRLRHMLIPAPSDVLAAERRLRAGEAFAKVARELSIAPSGELGGDFGWVARGTLPPDWEEVLFQLKPGERRALPTPSGHQLIEVVERREAAPADFKRDRARLKSLLLQEKAFQALPAYLQELRSKAEIKSLGA